MKIEIFLNVIRFNHLPRDLRPALRHLEWGQHIIPLTRKKRYFIQHKKNEKIYQIY